MQTSIVLRFCVLAIAAAASVSAHEDAMQHERQLSVAQDGMKSGVEKVIVDPHGSRMLKGEVGVLGGLGGGMPGGLDANGIGGNRLGGHTMHETHPPSHKKHKHKSEGHSKLPHVRRMLRGEVVGGGEGGEDGKIGGGNTKHKTRAHKGKKKKNTPSIFDTPPPFFSNVDMM